MAACRPSRPPRRPVLADVVYEALLQRLVAGELRPGDHLVEPQLADELSCSRTPLRSALTRLVSEGVLVQRSHCGCFVAEPTPAELGQVHQVRAAIEGLAAGLMAQRATAADLRFLGECCESLAAARATLDLPAYNRHDFHFHRYLVQACGNPYVTGAGNAGSLVLLSFLVPAYHELTPETSRLWPAPEGQDGHADIYQAIALRNAAGAEQAMRQHIALADRVVQTYLAHSPREEVACPA